ncbi:TetR/AcrR family transcriptional regulator [Mycobacterium deserti]|uniref:TetR/AcrR family transcriptional regulator n=1 Tax=Mycobacterium deserti TaxID=2978347 RepID=A0ABT2MDI4_9MYCO|nr:TetR/AcrR family transcriptional regulator [Mycobacterium deserti]MCT7660322.1 TetR/AcrR family transcriptional regulator [Mycobacterium deserti]
MNYEHRSLNMVHQTLGNTRVVPRASDKESRRRDILRAGRSLLREQGLAALQMREVARGAGVALGTVYIYFPTKESLFVALFAERLEQMSAELAPTLAAVTDLEELFVAVATSYRDVYVDSGGNLDILAAINDGSRLKPEIRDRLVEATGRVLDAVRVIVERALAQFEPADAPDPDLVLSLLWSTVSGLADHFTSVRHLMHRYTWDDTVRFTARTVIRGLLSDGVASTANRYPDETTSTPRFGHS